MSAAPSYTWLRCDTLEQWEAVTRQNTFIPDTWPVLVGLADIGDGKKVVIPLPAKQARKLLRKSQK